MTLHLQTQLIDEGEKRLVVKQKLLDFRTKGGAFLAVEEEPEAKTVGFFVCHKGFGATFRQSKAD